MSNITIHQDELDAIALDIIGLIKANTYAGRDMDGKPFEPYSQRPFAMPAGAYYRYLGSVGKRSEGAKRYVKQGNKLKFFRAKSGNLWVVVEGGYLALKNARFKTGERTVNLAVRGERGGMLGSMQIVARGTGSVTIGFSSPEAARIASYHQVMGAGKSRVIRKFFGLPTKMKQAIFEKMKQAVTIDWGSVRGV